MNAFLCAVSPRYPENYQIGLVAKTWGVKREYENRIRQTTVGDELIFMTTQEIRSIHRIESPVFEKSSLLWPAMDGDIFPFRIKISDPTHSGVIHSHEFAEKISFMRDCKRWTGTIQGRNGVFNNHLTESDVAYIKSRLVAGINAYAADVQSGLRAAEQPKIQNLFKLIGSDVLESLKRILPSLGLVRYNGKDFPAEYDLGYGGNVILCREIEGGDLVVVDFNRGEAPSETLLRLLHYMSWVRQHLASGKDVSGMILTEKADDALQAIVREVPNISLRYYRIGIELVNPDRLSA
jgi:hypothetical protein